MTESASEDGSNHSIASTLLRIAATAVLIVGLVLGGLTVWAWLSPGEDEMLPLEYEGFD